MKTWFPALKFAAVLLIALFLAGNAGHAYANSGGGHGGGEKKSSEEAKKDAKKDAKSKKKEVVTITGGQGGEDPIYLHLSPITLPIINDYGAQQIVTMIIDLHISDLESAQKMQNDMPRLKDALLQALYGGLSDGSMRNANVLDIGKIKASIETTLNRIFGAGKVLDVLVQAVSQRKL